MGQGVYDHLTRKRKLLAEQLGADISLARVAVRDKSKKRDVEIDPSLITEDSLSVATDLEIDVVCELMGGTGLALEIVTRALVAGKIVVTANKAALVKSFSLPLKSMEVTCCLKRAWLGDTGYQANRGGLIINDFFHIDGILNAATIS